MAGVSTYGQVLSQINRFTTLQGQFDNLSYQLSSGKKTQTFSGLGSDILAVQRARADVNNIDTYINNIDNANRRIDAELTALQEFKAQTENLAGLMVGFSQQGSHQAGDIIIQTDPVTGEETYIGYNNSNVDVNFQNLQALAGNISDFMLDLVNEQEGNRYLFAGADTSTKPLESLDLLESALNTSITNWKDEGSVNNITTEEFIQDLTDRTTADGNSDAFTDTIIGYSASLSAGTAGDVFVRISDQSELDYTVLGNDTGFRDVFLAVGVLKNENLPPISDVYAEPYTFGDNATVDGAPGSDLENQQQNFYDVFNQLTQMVVNAVDEIDEQIFNIQSVQARMQQTQNNYESERNLFLSIIEDAENADINQVAIEINSLQITLDASYRVVAAVQEISLVNFI